MAGAYASRRGRRDAKDRWGPVLRPFGNAAGAHRKGARVGKNPISTGIAAALLAGGILTSHAAWSAGLEDEISGLLDSHPLIQAARKNVQSAGEGITSARSGYLPDVKVGGYTGPNFSSSADRQASPGQPFMRNGELAGITVTQHIYDGDATNAAVDTAIGGQKVSEAQLRMTRQNTILEGVIAYLDVNRQNTLVKLARENEKRVQTQLNLEDERVQRGSGMAVDVLSAKQRLQVAKERRIAFEGTLQQALDRYQQVFGHAPDLSADFSRTPLPPVDLIPASLDDAVKTALDENPAVDVARKNIDVASQRTRSAEAGYYPTLDLVGNADYASYANATDGMRRDWSILLQLNWSLFSGFKTQAQVAQASYDYAASKDNSNQAGRKAAEAVRLAWTQLATAKERLKLLENAVNLAHEVYEARKKMREAGKETLINVLDAESAITNADITYAMADYDLRTAAYQLVHDVGRLEVADLDRRTSGAASSPKAQ